MIFQLPLIHNTEAHPGLSAHLEKDSLQEMVSRNFNMDKESSSLLKHGESEFDSRLVSACRFP